MAVSVTPAPAARKRIEFIDLLRGWAVIVMIETHVMNATLTDDITGSGFFQVLKFINGLVAPSFLFASGLAYAVTTRRKLKDYLSFGVPLFRNIGRLLFIVLIGYSLHIPKFNFHHLMYVAGERAWQTFYQVDVLQCIGVSLLVLQAFLLALRSERRLYAAAGVLATAVILVTPFAWGIDFWTVLPVPVASYFNGLHFSLFPLFPWSAFLLAGSVTGFLYAESREREGKGNTERQEAGGQRQEARGQMQEERSQRQEARGEEQRMMTRTIGVGCVLIILSFLIEPVASRLYPTYDYWGFSPSFVLLRMGLVLLLCAGMFFYERIRGVSPRSVVTLVGRESLLVYAVHLLLIYGNFGTFNFHDRVKNSFGYPEAILTIIVLWILMYFLALGWSRMKRGDVRVRRAVQFGALAVLLVVFFFGPEA